MPAATRDRTWRIQIFTDLGADPRIEFLRERVKTYPDGDVVRAALPASVRQLAPIASATLPGGAATITTYGDLAALLSAIGDAWALADVKAADDAAKAEAAERAKSKGKA